MNRVEDKQMATTNVEENEGLEAFAGHIAKCSRCADAFQKDEMPDTHTESYCPEGRRTWDLE